MEDTKEINPTGETFQQVLVNVMRKTVLDGLNGRSSSLFHYTSLESLMKIVESKSLWFTRSDFLNDLTEGKEIDRIYEEVCKKLLKEGFDKNYIDVIKNIKPKSNVVMLKKTIGEGGKQTPIYCAENSEFESDAYICSFSRNNDSLMLWNYYNNGDLTNCCNFQISADAIENRYPNVSIELRFEEVIYKDNEKIEKICELIRPLYDVRDLDEDLSHTKKFIENRLAKFQFIFKNEAYSNEEEIRAVFYVPKGKEAEMDIKHRNGNGMEISYIFMDLDIETIDRITLGPRNCSEELPDNIKKCLLSKGSYPLKDKSKIPARF